MINQFFCNCFNLSVPPLSTASGDSGSSEDCPSYLLCSNVEVVKLLIQIPSNTFTGPDGISAHMLRETSYSISSPLTSIFNLSIKSGIFPDGWKNSHIIPIPKHTSALSSPTGYRPIYLLPLISKVLERQIFNWLLDFCQTHNLLSDTQFSFRPGHSTESTLITSTNSWFTQVDKGYFICATFFDLTKAFDSVPHQPLLDVLFSLDIPHHLIVWLQSYLILRSQQVVVDGCSSSKSTVLSGVPQGSILGPRLFILYVNDIFQLPFSSTSSIILYADNILLSCSFKSSFEFSLAQSNVNILSSWVKSKHLTINHSKTKYMVTSIVNFTITLLLLFLLNCI